MKKWMIVPILGILLLLAACGGSASLPEGFSEEEVRAEAEEVVKLLNGKDSETLREKSTEQLKQGLDETALEQVYALLAEAGPYDSIENISIAGAQNKENNEELAVAVVKAKYELKTITYTLSFTKQMKLAGLFLK